MKNILPIMIAKGESTRLPGKNIKNFNGMPLFQWNLGKLLSLFDEVVVDSDDKDILESAENMGAIPHIRRSDVIGNEVPSIKIFKSILDDFDTYDGIINIQANSPNVRKNLIFKAFNIIKEGCSDHILTLNEDMSWNGSIWCISRDVIYSTKDFYDIKPDMYLLDDSIDIHTQEEFDLALKKEGLSSGQM